MSVELPLTSADGLKEALTPVGSPGAESSTAPSPKDLNCSGIATAPLLMEYDGI